MEIEVVSFLPIDNAGWYNNTRCLADVFIRYGDLDIHGCKIMENKKGEKFLAMPRHRNSAGVQNSTINVQSRDKYIAFREYVLEQYEEEFGG